jgi:hypothetical protein
MKRMYVILAVMFLTSFVADAQTLSAKVKNYLNLNYPNWEVCKFNKVEYQANSAVDKGDFNGDGKTDYAVAICKDDRIYALALLETKKSYKAFNLLAQNEENRWIAGLSVAGKGEEVFLHNDQGDVTKSFRLKTDGIAIYDSEGMSSIYYWQNDKFLFGNSF